MDKEFFLEICKKMSSFPVINQKWVNFWGLNPNRATKSRNKSNLCSQGNFRPGLVLCWLWRQRICGHSLLGSSGFCPTGARRRKVPAGNQIKKLNQRNGGAAVDYWPTKRGKFASKTGWVCPKSGVCFPRQTKGRRRGITSIPMEWLEQLDNMEEICSFFVIKVLFSMLLLLICTSFFFSMFSNMFKNIK